MSLLRYLVYTKGLDSNRELVDFKFLFEVKFNNYFDLILLSN